LLKMMKQKRRKKRRKKEEKKEEKADGDAKKPIYPIPGIGKKV